MRKATLVSWSAESRPGMTMKKQAGKTVAPKGVQSPGNPLEGSDRKGLDLSRNSSSNVSRSSGSEISIESDDFTDSTSDEE